MPTCGYCGGTVQPFWKACPGCGAGIASGAPAEPLKVVVVQQPAPLPPSTPASPASSAGCCTVSTLGLLFLSGGMLVSLTGVGLVLGVPMILVGVLIPLLSIAASNWDGPCPHCRSTMRVPVQGSQFTCGACKRKFVLDQTARQFHAVP